MTQPARTPPSFAVPPEPPASGPALPSTSTGSDPGPDLLREPSPALLAHLQDRRVFDRLHRFVLKQNVPRRYAEDVVQRSLLEAWRGRHKWGPTTEDLDKLLYAIAGCNVSDEKKRWFRTRPPRKGHATPERDPKTDAETEYTGPAERDEGDALPVAISPSVHASLVTQPDPHEERAQIRNVSGFVEKTPGMLKAASWLARHIAGESFREIAEREGDGTSENRVCVAVSRLRATLRDAAKEGLIVLVLALFVGMLFKHMHHSPKNDRGLATPKPVPTEVAPSPEPTPEANAEDLRREAAVACGIQEWDTCLADLDDAKRLDPKGDDAPRVKELRKQAEDGIRHRKP